jgi:hypothetical protein
MRISQITLMIAHHIEILKSNIIKGPASTILFIMATSGSNMSGLMAKVCKLSSLEGKTGHMCFSSHFPSALSRFIIVSAPLCFSLQPTCYDGIYSD